MISGLLNGIVESCLSRYVESVDDGLGVFGGVSLWDGSLTLSNVVLRKEAFEGFAGGFSIRSFRIGFVSLHIPWTSLGSDSVELTVEDVEIALGSDSTLNDSSQALLLASDVLMATRFKAITADSGDEDNTFLNKFKRNLISNLRITVRRLRMRVYNISDSCIVLGLRACVLQSTDEFWNPTFVSGSGTDDFLYKNVKFTEVSLHFEGHERVVEKDIDPPAYIFLFEPLNFTINARLLNSGSQARVSLGMPSITLDVLVKNMVLNLDAETINVLIELKSQYSSSPEDLQGLYRPSQRPRKGDFITNRAWWRYSLHLILLHYKPSPRTWVYRQGYFKDFTSYVNHYKVKLTSPGQANLDILREIELRCTVAQVLFMRDFAFELSVEEYLLMSTSTSTASSFIMDYFTSGAEWLWGRKSFDDIPALLGSTVSTGTFDHNHILHISLELGSTEVFISDIPHTPFTKWVINGVTIKFSKRDFEISTSLDMSSLSIDMLDGCNNSSSILSTVFHEQELLSLRLNTISNQPIDVYFHLMPVELTLSTSWISRCIIFYKRVSQSPLYRTRAFMKTTRPTFVESLAYCHMQRLVDVNVRINTPRLIIPCHHSDSSFIILIVDSISLCTLVGGDQSIMSPAAQVDAQNLYDSYSLAIDNFRVHFLGETCADSVIVDPLSLIVTVNRVCISNSVVSVFVKGQLDPVFVNLTCLQFNNLWDTLISIVHMDSDTGSSPSTLEILKDPQDLTTVLPISCALPEDSILFDVRFEITTLSLMLLQDNNEQFMRLTISGTVLTLSRQVQDYCGDLSLHSVLVEDYTQLINGSATAIISLHSEYENFAKIQFVYLIPKSPRFSNVQIKVTLDMQILHFVWNVETFECLKSFRNFGASHSRECNGCTDSQCLEQIFNWTSVIRLNEFLRLDSVEYSPQDIELVLNTCQISLFLHDQAVCLFRSSISNVSINVNKSNSDVFVDGKIEDIGLSSEVQMTQFYNPYIFSKRASVSSFVEFEYKTTKLDYGQIAKLRVLVSSLTCYFIPEEISGLLQLLQHGLLRNSRHSIISSSRRTQSNLLLYDIQFEKPIMFFPRALSQLQKLIAIDFGVISLRNEFILSKEKNFTFTFKDGSPTSRRGCIPISRSYLTVKDLKVSCSPRVPSGALLCIVNNINVQVVVEHVKCGDMIVFELPSRVSNITVSKIDILLSDHEFALAASIVGDLKCFLSGNDVIDTNNCIEYSSESIVHSFMEVHLAGISIELTVMEGYASTGVVSEVVSSLLILSFAECSVVIEKRLNGLELSRFRLKNITILDKSLPDIPISTRSIIGSEDPSAPVELEITCVRDNVHLRLEVTISSVQVILVPESIFALSYATMGFLPSIGATSTVSKNPIHRRVQGCVTISKGSRLFFLGDLNSENAICMYGDVSVTFKRSKTSELLIRAELSIIQALLCYRLSSLDLKTLIPCPIPFLALPALLSIEYERGESGSIRLITLLESSVDIVVSLQDILTCAHIAQHTLRVHSQHNNNPSVAHASARPYLISPWILECRIIIMNGVSLAVVNDSPGYYLPLVLVRIADFNAIASRLLYVNPTKSDVTYDISIHSKLEVNYHNRIVQHWEPFLEEWDFELSVTRSKLKERDLWKVELLSRDVLNLNFHESLYSSLTTGIDGIKYYFIPSIQQILDRSIQERSHHNLYFLRNETGCRLMLVEPSGEHRLVEIGEEFNLEVSQCIRGGDRRSWNYECPSVSLQLEGILEGDWKYWEVISCIPLDSGNSIREVKRQVTSVTSELSSSVGTTLINFNVSDKDSGSKLLSIKSPVTISNRTQTAMRVRIFRYGSPAFERVIEAGEYIPVPVRYLERGSGYESLCFSPEISGFSFSEPACSVYEVQQFFLFQPRILCCTRDNDCLDALSEWDIMDSIEVDMREYWYCIQSTHSFTQNHFDLSLLPPYVFKNSLPRTLHFSIRSTPATMLRPGYLTHDLLYVIIAEGELDHNEEIHIHTFDPSESSLEVSCVVPGFSTLGYTSVFPPSFTPALASKGSYTLHAPLTDMSGISLNLQFITSWTSFCTLENGQTSPVLLNTQMLVPFLLVNRTSLDLLFAQYFDFEGNYLLAPGQGDYERSGIFQHHKLSELKTLAFISLINTPPWYALVAARKKEKESGWVGFRQLLPSVLSTDYQDRIHHIDSVHSDVMFDFIEPHDSSSMFRLCIKTPSGDWSPAFTVDGFEGGSICLQDSVERSKIHKAYDINVSLQANDEFTKVVVFSPKFRLTNSTCKSLEFRQVGTYQREIIDPGAHRAVFRIHPQKPNVYCIRFSEFGWVWSGSVDFELVGDFAVRVLNRHTHECTIVKLTIQSTSGSIGITIVEDVEEVPYRIENLTFLTITYHQEDEIEDFRKGKVLPFHIVKYAWDSPLQSKHIVLRVLYGHEDNLCEAYLGTFSLDRITEYPPVQLHYKESTGNGIMPISKNIYISVHAEGHVRVLTLTDTLTVQPRSSRELYDGSSTSVRTGKLTIHLARLGLSVIDSSISFRNPPSSPPVELLYLSLEDFGLSYETTVHSDSLTVTTAKVQVDNQVTGCQHPVVVSPLFPLGLGNVLELEVILNHRHSTRNSVFLSLFVVSIEGFAVKVEDELLDKLLSFKRRIFPPSPRSIFLGTPRSVYIQTMLIRPFELCLTYTSSPNGPYSHNFPHGLVRAMRVSLVNMEDAKVHFKALVMSNTFFYSYQEFVSCTVEHFRTGAMWEFYKLVGSVDFLGNPIGLMNNLRTGVTDLIYQPYQGIVVISPTRFLFGLYQGCLSLLLNIVYGMTNSLGKISSSISKGLCALSTFEGNHPSDSLSDVIDPAQRFLDSTGIVSQVHELYKELFIKCTGLVFLPLVGSFNTLSSICFFLKNVVDTRSMAHRKRPPRFFLHGKILTPFSRFVDPNLHRFWKDYPADSSSGDFFCEYGTCPDGFVVVSSNNLIRVSATDLVSDIYDLSLIRGIVSVDTLLHLRVGASMSPLIIEFNTPAEAFRVYEAAIMVSQSSSV